jgi:hypothetical protein
LLWGPAAKLALWPTIAICRDDATACKAGQFRASFAREPLCRGRATDETRTREGPRRPSPAIAANRGRLRRGVHDPCRVVPHPGLLGSLLLPVLLLRSRVRPRHRRVGRRTACSCAGQRCGLRDLPRGPGGASLAAMAAIALVDAIDQTLLRNVIVGGWLAIVGAVLGTACPVGVRLAAPAGPSTVEWMWAINGAASVAGPTLAALIGLARGSRAVLAAGLACYLLAALCGLAARRLRQGRPAEHLTPDRSHSRR